MLQRIKALIEDCSNGSKMWLLMQSDSFSFSFHELTLDLWTLLEILPQKELNLSEDVIELRNLAIKQCRDDKSSFIDPIDKGLRVEVLNMLDSIKREIVPDHSRLGDIFVRLGLSDSASCRDEIECLEDEVQCQTDERSKSELQRRSFLSQHFPSDSLSQRQMSIFEYNGSALVAMVGKNCFAIAGDRRLGVQLQTIATDFQRIYKIHDRLFIGLSGLGTDAQTLYQRLVFRHKLYQLREERDMKPETFASLVSAVLYEKRFGPYFCQPVIAGLSDEDKPFICTMDAIGAKELAKDFVVAGTASESLYGACEAMYKPDLEPEELFETVSQALLASVDRDCLSGWGGHVYLVTPTEIKERILKGRMD